MLYNIYEIDYLGICYAKKRSISGFRKKGVTAMNIKKIIENMKKRFGKEDETDYMKVCALCEFCTETPEEDGTVFTCEKYGKVEEDHSCRKFRYDLLKRAPKARREMPKLEFVSLDDEEENEETKEDTNENDTGKEI